jgi:hypothetical protein
MSDEYLFKGTKQFILNNTMIQAKSNVQPSRALEVQPVPNPQRKKGRWITYDEEIAGKIYKCKVYIKEKESIYKKMMTKLNKKTFTKPSGVGVAKR